MKPLNLFGFIQVLILGSFGLFSLIFWFEKTDHYHLLGIFVMCILLCLAIFKSDRK